MFKKLLLVGTLAITFQVQAVPMWFSCETEVGYDTVPGDSDDVPTDSFGNCCSPLEHINSVSDGQGQENTYIQVPTSALKNLLQSLGPANFKKLDTEEKRE